MRSILRCLRPQWTKSASPARCPTGTLNFKLHKTNLYNLTAHTLNLIPQTAYNAKTLTSLNPQPLYPKCLKLYEHHQDLLQKEAQRIAGAEQHASTIDSRGHSELGSP